MMDLSVKIEDIHSAIEDSKVKHFFTTFDHLNAHYGIRRGCYSIYMGTTSGGKSSLMKPIGVQASTTPGVRVLFWLSEELKAKYAKGMNSYCTQVGADLSKIGFFEESSINPALIKTHREFLNYFKEVVCSFGADIVIIDNLTTSRFYGPRTNLYSQGETVQFLKEFSQDADIALVGVIHTASGVSDNMGRLFTTEDVKGLRSISLEASYFYALQKFTKNGEIFPFLRTLKYRDHDTAAGTYLLKYDPTISVYVGDVKVDFEKVKQIFKESDRLK
jgi:hypothetical protein